MSIAKVLVLSAMLIAPMATSQASAQEMTSGVFRVNKGASQKINEFGVCRIVRNTGAAPVMVPAGSAAQWHQGNRAFLNNVNGMPGVQVSACETKLKPVPASLPKCTVQFYDRLEHFLIGSMWNTITPNKGNPNGADMGFREYAKSSCLSNNSIAWSNYTGADRDIAGFIEYAYDGGVLNDAFDFNAGSSIGMGQNPPSCEGRDPGIYLWRDLDSYGWNHNTQHYHGHVIIYPFVCE